MSAKRGAELFNRKLAEWFKSNAAFMTDGLHQAAVLEALTAANNNTPIGNPKNWKINKGRAERGLPIYSPPNYVGGHARRNWQVSYGSPLKEVLPGIDQGGQTLQGNIKAAMALPVGGRVYITNNVPYIVVIDQGRPGYKPLYKPWSKQAPKGLIKPILDAVLQRLRLLKIGDLKSSIRSGAFQLRTK